MAFGSALAGLAKAIGRSSAPIAEEAMGRGISSIKKLPSDEVYIARAARGRAEGLGREQPIPSLTESGKTNQQIIADHQQVLKNKGSGFKDERIPDLEESIRGIDEGKQTVRGHEELVEQLKPIRRHKRSPTVIEAEEIPLVLDDNKYLQKGIKKEDSGIYNYDLEIPDGQRTQVRLDIPAYERFNKWVAALKLPKFLGGTYYSPTVVLKNVKFKHGTQGAKKVGRGEKTKYPFATLDGEWVNHNPNEIQKIVDEIIVKNNKDWVQVGYDPRRHGHFYTREPFRIVDGIRKKGSVIEEAEEIIQVGPLVLAKNPIFSDIKVYKKGGQVMKNYHKNYNTQRII